MTIMETETTEAVFMPARDPARRITPANGTDFELTELYELLNCDLIETLALPDGRLLIFDEEGKLLERPHNEHASQLAAAAGVHLTDHIAGPAIICNQSQLK